MKGHIHVTVSNRRVRYDFTIHRNITIIQGDSATGKTTLLDMIGDFYNQGADSGVTLQCEKTCVVLSGRNWQVLLSSITDSLVFIDEGNRFVNSEDFAKAIRGTGNYYIIVTRESLHQLPYSVTEIYGLRESGKYGGLHQTYNEMYRLYGKRNYAGIIRPATLVTEDAGSGFQFFSHISRENHLDCLTAGGKSNIFKLLPRLHRKKPVLVIADGAAFGSEIARVSLLLKSAPDVYLYLPESFEWLLLSSGILHSSEISRILRDPALFIDSRGFLSWEQYFTALLTDTTKGTYLAYAKSQLNANYLRPEAVNQILAVMKGITLLPQTE